MRHVAVGDLMTRNFVSVHPDINLLFCVKEMIKKKVSGILVIDNKRLVGILTYKDILWAISKKPKINFKEVRAIDIATKKIAVIKPSANIVEAFNKMKNLGLRRLPVLSKGEVAGILTLKDILKIDPSLYADTGELTEVMEEEEKLKKVMKRAPTEGLCEECGALSELLSVDNRLLCLDCREDLY